VSERKSTDNGQLRPSGKRQLEDADGTTTKTAKVSAATRVNGPDGREKRGGVLAYPKSVGSEVKKVIWPTGREMVTYTIVTLLFLIVITALCAGVDVLTGKGVEFIFGL
jgi:preprotein translocase subunit SecE